MCVNNMHFRSIEEDSALTYIDGTIAAHISTTICDPKRCNFLLMQFAGMYSLILLKLFFVTAKKLTFKMP